MPLLKVIGNIEHLQSVNSPFDVLSSQSPVLASRMPSASLALAHDDGVRLMKRIGICRPK